MNLTSARLPEPPLRDAGPPIPKLITGCFLLASSSLLVLVVVVFTLFGLREIHGTAPHEHPTLLLGVFRLVLALPFLLLFGVVVGSSEGMPRVATLTLSSTTALLTLWMVFEAAPEIHGEVPGDERVELIINALMVVAILATLFYGSRAAQQAAERELKARERDPLTGLLNRQEVQAFFEQTTGLVTLLMLDLNGLKTVNDMAGHAAGDARLRAAADVLCAVLPPGAEAGRWGDDEFVAVLAGCPVAEALEHRDLETAGHTERVVTLAAQLGEALGLSPLELEALRQGAYLHDIGKLAVPDAVLLKRGKLTACEWEAMHAHSAKGFEIAARIPTLSREALEVIRHHHERWDGLGYPDGLAGDAVPLAARIFAVCDVFDALTSQRPYKRSWTHAEALREVEAQAGKQFDPQVARVFLAMAQRASDQVSR